nr:hypothetical protein BaRGS_010875 [Batillaria attramentaria]
MAQYRLILSGIFQFLNKNRSDWTVKQTLQEQNCVLVESGEEFVRCDKFWVQRKQGNDIDLKPYRFPLPGDMMEAKDLFLQCGSAQRQDESMLQQVLEEIRSSHEDQMPSQEKFDRDLSLVKQILDKLKTCQFIPKGTVLLPIEHDQGRVLKFRPASECTIGGQAGTFDAEEQEIFCVLQDIHTSTAKSLGALDIRERALTGVEGLDFKYEQVEELTTRLHNLLNDSYTDGFSVPKELIQNADDAGASEVRFLLDERENLDATSNLISDNMASLQGAAIWAFNDATFTDEDFANIVKLGPLRDSVLKHCTAFWSNNRDIKILEQVRIEVDVTNEAKAVCDVNICRAYLLLLENLHGEAATDTDFRRYFDLWPDTGKESIDNVFYKRLVSDNNIVFPVPGSSSLQHGNEMNFCSFDCLARLEKLGMIVDDMPLGMIVERAESVKTLMAEDRDEGYTFDSSLFKELLQNADDAGATEIKLILDMRNLGTEKPAVTGDKMKKVLQDFRGEAKGCLLFLNNLQKIGIYHVNDSGDLELEVGFSDKDNVSDKLLNEWKRKNFRLLPRGGVAVMLSQKKKRNIKQPSALSITVHSVFFRCQCPLDYTCMSTATLFWITSTAEICGTPLQTVSNVKSLIKYIKYDPEFLDKLEGFVFAQTEADGKSLHVEEMKIVKLAVEDIPDEDPVYIYAIVIGEVKQEGQDEVPLLARRYRIDLGPERGEAVVSVTQLYKFAIQRYVDLLKQGKTLPEDEDEECGGSYRGNQNDDDQRYFLCTLA